MFNVYCLGEAPPVRFAARELCKYLARATGERPSLRRRRRYRSDAPGLWLATFGDLGDAVPAPASDDPMDDEILIRTGRTGGLIAGANPRSVLLAAYRYLTDLGFRWVRAGRDGEVVPNLASPCRKVDLHETPTYRHRNVCIEGACSFEHVRDMVDWMPKVGMNSCFIEFYGGLEYFRRWHEHRLNPTLKGRSLSLAEGERLRERIIAEMVKRGLFIHNMGHGWTGVPLGIPATGWGLDRRKITPAQRRLLAKVNGRRALHGGRPMNTQLCYGNPRARRLLTDAIVEFAAEHPEIDLLHFWLADGANNHCECSLCRPHRPADLYVKMLNELDEKLSARGLDTRIVFLIYVDLLWPPAREKIRNQGRFVLMFAPITRRFSESLPVTSDGSRPAPYRRNRLKFPGSTGKYLVYLDAWRKGFEGDSFSYDYHFWMAQHREPAHHNLARVMHGDLRNMKDIPIEGMSCCQTLRVFFPTGFAMTLTARMLWNRRLGFREIAADYFAAAFGPKGAEVEKYLQRLSNALRPWAFGRREGGYDEHASDELDDARRALRALGRVPGLVAGFRPIMARGMKSAVPVRSKSWFYLNEHADLCLALAEALREYHGGNRERGRELGWGVIEKLRRIEPRVHRVLDVFNMLRAVARMFGYTDDDLGGAK